MTAIRQIRKDTPFVKYDEIERLMRLAHEGTNHGRVELNDHIEAVRSANKLVFTYRLDSTFEYRPIAQDRWISMPELAGEIRITRFSGKAQNIRFTTNPFIELIDGDFCDQEFWLRTWREGDRFQPLGMKGYKKLHDFFIDLKVDYHLRHQIPLLINREEIVWVVGYRISDQFRVKPTTNQIVQIEWRNN